MNTDLVASLSLLASVLVAGCLYTIRLPRFGAKGHERVERAGASPMLGRATMEATYWVLEPIAKRLVALGVSANAVTTSSLVLGVVAGALLATGHFGLAAAAATASALADALDGLVARRSGTGSDAGEVFDAAVDRYVELFFLGGVALYFRENELALGCALAALGGSFMVSYASAKAEALGVPAPRGAMRRAERAVVLGLGAALTPLAAELVPRLRLSPELATLPMLSATVLVAVAANVSAARRLLVIARGARALAQGQPAAEAKPSNLNGRAVVQTHLR